MVARSPTLQWKPLAVIATLMWCCPTAAPRYLVIDLAYELHIYSRRSNLKYSYLPEEAVPFCFALISPARTHPPTHPPLPQYSTITEPAAIPGGRGGAAPGPGGVGARSRSRHVLRYVSQDHVVEVKQPEPHHIFERDAAGHGTGRQSNPRPSWDSGEQGDHRARRGEVCRLRSASAVSSSAVSVYVVCSRVGAVCQRQRHVLIKCS